MLATYIIDKLPSLRVISSGKTKDTFRNRDIMFALIVLQNDIRMLRHEVRELAERNCRLESHSDKAPQNDGGSSARENMDRERQN